MLACRKSLGLRDGSFFEKSKLSLKQWVVLMYWWVRQYPVGDASQEAEIKEECHTGIPVSEGYLQLANRQC